MVHLLFLMRRKPGLSRAECQRHWREIHAPLAQRIPGMRRYVQSHVIAAANEETPYDGAAEIWVNDETAATTVFQSKEYKEGAYLDEPKFVDIKSALRLQTEDRMIFAGAPMSKTEGLVKRMSFIKRKPGMSREEFSCYWQDVHGPIASKLPGLRRYLQCHTLPSMYANGEPPFDGVAQVWFTDTAALDKAFSSRVYLEEARPDGQKFIAPDGVMGLLIQENRVIWSDW
ncbi:MAG: EthD family reductase [Candidatus Binatia bacterium]